MIKYVVVAFVFAAVLLLSAGQSGKPGHLSAAGKTRELGELRVCGLEISGQDCQRNDRNGNQPHSGLDSQG